MADIVIADSTGHYDGRYLETHPLGATETSVIYLARALAKRGHSVTVFTIVMPPSSTKTSIGVRSRAQRREAAISTLRPSMPSSWDSSKPRAGG